MLGVRASCLTALAAAGLLGAPACAWAQDTLREAMFGSRAEDGREQSAPPVARYVAETGQSFVLDRSGAAPLLKFEQGNEVWALRPMPGPRGDVIYKNDVGQPVVRTTQLGGLTLYAPGRPTGVPAALSGQAGGLHPGKMSPAALLQRFAQASAKASRAARRLIPFEAPDVTPGAEAVFADAAALSAEAIVKLAAAGKGAAVARVRRVRVRAGTATSARMTAETVEITVAPAQGPAGRPSSERVARTIVAGR